MTWSSDRFPPMRAEAHYGGRVLDCFADRPPHIFAMFEAAARITPDREAFVDDTRRLTWDAAGTEIARLAGALVARGVKPGDRVAMVLSNSIDFPLTLFAIQRIGAVCVPIAIRSSVAEVAFIMENSEARLLVHEAATADLVPDGTDAADIVDLRGTATLPDADAMPHEDDVALILYTSGTTGKPKGATLTHLGVVHAGIYYAHALALGPEDRVACVVPLNHVTGIAALIAAPVTAGATLIVLPRFKAAEFLDRAEAERMTYTLMVPAMYNLCLLDERLAQRDLSAWRLGAYGGAPMPEATIRRMAQAVEGLQFANCYGSTESIVAQIITPPELGFERREYVGCPLPGTEVRVMDTDGIEVPRGAEGELWLRGPNVVPGYWKNPQATQDGFCDGYWRSGDIGRMDEDGFVQVLDRMKDMINRGGHKIYCSELESVLTAHDAVVEAAAIARPCPVMGERVHAVVVTKAAVEKEAVLAWCRDRLSDYKVPETMTLQSEPLPRNANGKVDKKILRQEDAAASP